MFLLDGIYHLDIALLDLINLKMADPNLDQFWLFITHFDRDPLLRFFLLPILLGALLFIYRARGVRLLVALTLVVGVTDLISYRVVKALVQRPRPFQNSEISKWVRKIDDAHGPSFPSNHAANCFAGAMVLAWYFPRSRHFVFTFASLVALSRVAVGVHYPSDVVFGAWLGIFVGFIFRILVFTQIPWFWLIRPVSDQDIESGNWRTRTRRLSDV